MLNENHNEVKRTLIRHAMSRNSTRGSNHKKDNDEQDGDRRHEVEKGRGITYFPDAGKQIEKWDERRELR